MNHLKRATLYSRPIPWLLLVACAVVLPHTFGQADQTALRLLHISDTHVCNLDGLDARFVGKRKHFGNGPATLRRFLETIPQQTGAAAVAITGDLIDFYEAQSSDADMRAGEVEAFSRLISLSPVPIWAALGNHDLASYWFEGDRYLNGHHNAEAAKAAWVRNLPSLSQGTYCSVRRRLGKTFYRLIFLSNGYNESKLPGDLTDQVQERWLSRQLEEGSNDVNVVFMHIPILVGDTNGDGVFFSKPPAGWPFEDTYQKGLMKILNENPSVAALFVGHNHRNVIEEVPFPAGHRICQIQTGNFQNDPNNWRAITLGEREIRVSAPGSLEVEQTVAIPSAQTRSVDGPADPAAAAPPVVNSKPGLRYGDAVRMFQGIPGIERAPNGRLWATWYGGGLTEDHHNYVLLATSDDDGRSWQQVLVLDPDHDGPVRAFDPCLWHDPAGRLWLFWSQRGAGSPQLLAMSTEQSGAAKPVWSQPRWICDGIMMNKPTVLADGRWLLPTAIWRIEGSSRVVESNDRGLTWRLLGAANVPDKEDRNCDEPMLVQRRNGSLWMLVRTTYGIGESVSEDGGKTWSKVSPTTLTHPASRFFVRRLNSGRLLLVKHSPPSGRRVRSHLTVYLSDDDGIHWKGGLLLDERAGVSYPDGVQGADGLVYLIYDFDRRGQKQILMARFTEEDILQGKIVTARSRLRTLVNQATGRNPQSP